MSLHAHGFTVGAKGFPEGIAGGVPDLLQYLGTDTFAVMVQAQQLPGDMLKQTEQMHRLQQGTACITYCMSMGLRSSLILRVAIANSPIETRGENGRLQLQSCGLSVLL